jgi:hypothetical protein
MSLPSSWLIPGGCRGDWHRISSAVPLYGAISKKKRENLTNINHGILGFSYVQTKQYFPKMDGLAKSAKIGYHQWENQRMVWGTHVLGNLHMSLLMKGKTT